MEQPESIDGSEFGRLGSGHPRGGALVGVKPQFTDQSQLLGRAQRPAQRFPEKAITSRGDAQFPQRSSYNQAGLVVAGGRARHRPTLPAAAST